MALFLVRHAKAGHREFGPLDRERPLSTDGHAQARALVTYLADTPVSRLLTSPFTRCRQTLTPLAEATGLPLEDTFQLSEGAPFEPVLQLLSDLPDHSVLCSHGDLIPDVLQALVRRGLRVTGDEHWSKGSVWVLERTNGQMTAGSSFRL
jgi:phosphohistidine phosphatase SixA